MSHSPSSLCKGFILVTLLFLFFNSAIAQPNTGKHIDINAGYGLSMPFDDVDIYGSGFYVQGEYVWALTSWFGLRPYAGGIMTWKNNSETSERLQRYEVTSKAFLVGGKARLVAPIPWFAPFIESGVGASIGSFRTFTPYTDRKDSGILVHIPLTLGLALGPDHSFEFALTYYFLPTIRQINGGVGIGLSIPIAQH